MNLDDLRNANLSNLDKAVSEWDSMASKLYTFSSDVRSDVKGKSDKANWEGVNATVTREFIRQTATECDDLASSARSIHAILSGAASSLKGYQTDLTERIAQDSKDCYVRDNGNGTFTVEVRDDAPEGSDGKAETLKTDIEEILKNATTKDKSTAETLDALAKLTDKGFSGVTYSSEEEAAEALKDAERAAELAGQKPEDLSPEEFDELNDLMGAHRDDPLFSEKFATTLGPEKTLELWAGMTDPRSEVGRERHEQFAAFQENLSLTLATASHSDSTAMSRWKWDMVDLGGQQVGSGQKSYGFQVMSNLMRVGDFDDQFLDSYGNALINKEKELTQNGSLDHRYWTMMNNSAHLNFMGGDEADNGRDPFVGFMKALSNSPDASTEFFNDPFVTKDEDHDFENDDGDKRALSNFDYLFEEREWPESMHMEGGHNNDYSYDAMGEALEAATTGHPAGEVPKLEDIPHSPEQASLYQNIVESVSEDRGRLTDHDSMSDSMGRMSAEYMPEIHRALDPTDEHEADLYPVSGATAKLGEEDVTRFLYAVGRDPDGYAAVNVGQHNYTASLMEYHFNNPDAYLSDPSISETQNLNETIGKISERAGEVQGTIAAGRAYEAEVDGGAKDADYNAALDNVKTWGTGLAGVGVGLATAPYTGPGAIVAGGVASTAAGEVIDTLLGGMRQDSSDEVIYANGEDWGDTRDSTYQLVEQSATEAGKSSGNESSYIVATSVDRAEDGFNNAGQNIHDFIDGEGVPRALDTEE